MTVEALATAAREATRASDREHVTPFIRNNRARFTTETLISPLPGLTAERWTLDTADDLTFLRAVATRLPSVDRAPSHLEVLSVLEREPQLRKINRSESRNAGYAISVMREHVDTSRRFDRSRQLLGRAEKLVSHGAQRLFNSRVPFLTSSAPLFATYGDGGRIYDVDGSEYVDLTSALILGYRDPDVDVAIRRQLTRGIRFSLATADQMSLAERLVKHIPCAEAVQFVRSGSDARLAAVSLAREATRRDRIMQCGYHRWQEWSIAAPPRNLGAPASVSALSHTVSYGDLPVAAEMFQQHPDEFAGIILDLAGAPEPHDSYLHGLIELAHHHGALIIFDELVTGFRWSLGGAQGHYAVTPDLACFGDTMGNGMPISAVVGRADVMRAMQDNIFCLGTFGSESLATAAAIATVDKMERDDVVSRLWHMGGELMRAVGDKIAAAGLDHVVKLVGSPPSAMLAYRTHAQASKEAIKALLLGELLAAGVLINDSHNLCFAHSAVDIARVLAAYDHALAALREALDRGDIEHRLQKQVIKSLFAKNVAW
jgi:glutamate-1-semialdehyde 2,1-aminomutase/spore coat polysaccharide biosynthesis protein SpsF